MPLTPLQISQIEALCPLYPIDMIPPRDTEELFKALSFLLFNENRLLENAIDLIDHPSPRISCVQSSSFRRYLWKVSSKKHTYICLGTQSYHQFII